MTLSSQAQAWDDEYKNQQLMSLDAKPQGYVMYYRRWVKRKYGIDIREGRVLDLGCGTGRNSNYLATFGGGVVGIDFSPTILQLAQKRAEEMGVNVEYIEQSIGESYPFPDEHFHMALDITASNSLSEAERAVYLDEVYRVLKPGGHLFVRTLCKDTDKNAQNLLKLHPGPEKDTYIFPGLGFTERVFSREDFEATYSRFEILKLEKHEGYTRFNNQSYKRKFWAAYLRKGE